MKKFKILIIVPVMLLTAYPLAELTRYIIQYNSWTGINNRADNLAELILMWLFYLLVPVWISFMVNRLRKK